MTRREPSDREVSRRFKELTAGLDDLDLSLLDGADGPDSRSASPAQGPRDYIVDEQDEPFVHPHQAELDASLSLLVKCGWISVLIGVIGTIAVYWTGAPVFAGIISFTFIVIGFITLLWALPKRREDDPEGVV